MIANTKTNLRLTSPQGRNAAKASRRPTRRVVSGTEPPNPKPTLRRGLGAKTGQGGEVAGYEARHFIH